MDDNYYSTPNTSHRLRLVIIVAVVALIGLIIWIASIATNNAGKVNVAIHALPTYAKVYMNGHSVGSSSYLSPGNYTVRATAPGFDTYTGVFLVSATTTNPVLAITLNPVSKDAIAYSQSNQALYNKQASYGGQESQQQSALFFKKNPIAKNLPYQNPVYTIGYQVDPSDPSGQTIILTINAPSGFRNEAVNKIRDLGADPTNYKIIFENYTDPFK